MSGNPDEDAVTTEDLLISYALLKIQLTFLWQLNTEDELQVSLVRDQFALLCLHSHCFVFCFCLHISLQFKVDGEWWTWIDYERFHELIQQYNESNGAKTFTALDYMAKTPSWAVFGARERGFDPSDTRFLRKNKTKDISGC